MAKLFSERFAGQPMRFAAGLFEFDDDGYADLPDDQIELFRGVPHVNVIRDAKKATTSKKTKSETKKKIAAKKKK